MLRLLKRRPQAPHWLPADDVACASPSEDDDGEGEDEARFERSIGPISAQRPGYVSGFFGALAAQFQGERDRWFLWVPPLFAVGIAIYFALLSEPAWSWSIAPLVTMIVLRLALGAHQSMSVLANVAVIVAAGFLAAKVRAEIVAAPVLTSELRSAVVEGFVERLEYRPDGRVRMTLHVTAIEGLKDAETPARVRILAKTSQPLSPGEPVKLTAQLTAPGGPTLPRGYDFARAAYFMGIGGVGYAITPPVKVDATDEPSFGLAQRARLERFRRDIGQRIVNALTGEVGQMANALMTGERSGITRETNELYRDAGIFHILSISGLHMAIMGGSVFVALRFLLAAFPFIALRYPIKKWSAVLAAIATLGYLLISGGAHATVRSFIMILIMFVAILLDRPAIALRNVAIAAILILAAAPESLFNAGFQLSFAAVVALVSIYEALKVRRLRLRRLGIVSDMPAGQPWRTMRAFWVFTLGIAGTTVVAGLATGPLAAFHFHTSQQYAILTNMLAIPVSNMIVMPAALAAFVIMPAGLEAWPLAVMGFGIELMTASAKYVTGLPGAVIAVPAFSEAALQLMVFGGLWLCIWQWRWRMLGLVIVAAGVMVATTARQPDALISDDGRLVAVRDELGRLAAMPTRHGAFELSRWLESDGDRRESAAALSKLPFRCDLDGCTAKLKGLRIAMPRSPAALVDDCRQADLLVLTFPMPPGCRTDARVLDYWALQSGGVHAVYIDAGNQLSLQTVEDFRGNRPWTVAASDVLRRREKYQRRMAQARPAVARLQQGAGVSGHPEDGFIDRIDYVDDVDQSEDGWPLYWYR